MGWFVAYSRAVDPKSPWAAMHPDQRFLNSCSLAVLTLVLLGYAAAGLVFGHLPFFYGAEFAELVGLVALFLSVGSGALGLAWATHLVQRHWSTASARRWTRLRRVLYVVSGVCWVVAIPTALLPGFGVRFASVPLGLAPRSEWLLGPLPWAWKYGLKFASDRFVERLMVGGFVTLILLLIFLKSKWNRFTAIAICILISAVGAYFIGDASYRYAMGRGLGPVAVAELARDFKANPGLFNAWNFVGLWTGVTCLVFGSIAAASAIFVPRR